MATKQIGNVIVRIDVKLSLLDAIKLRIAGCKPDNIINEKIEEAERFGINSEDEKLLNKGK